MNYIIKEEAKENHDNILCISSNCNPSCRILRILTQIADLIEKEYGFRRIKCIDMATKYIESKDGSEFAVEHLNDYRDEIISMIEYNEII